MIDSNPTIVAPTMAENLLGIIKKRDPGSSRRVPTEAAIVAERVVSDFKAMELGLPTETDILITHNKRGGREVPIEMEIDPDRIVLRRLFEKPCKPAVVTIPVTSRRRNNITGNRPASVARLLSQVTEEIKELRRL